MPKIDVLLKTLEKLAGQKISPDDLKLVKADAEWGDNLKIEIGDTNRPDLWSVEGIARVIKGYRTGILPKIRVSSSGKSIIVDKSIKPIRPFIAGFIVKKMKITETVLKDIVQMQEKLSENYGRKRQKISIGIYPYDKIQWPVHYKAVEPKSIEFAPLEFKHAMSLDEIIKDHPKGIEYGYIIKHHNFFPIFMDHQDNILSFPPIINSNYLGKVEPGISSIFVEVTGTDLKSVLITTNILAQNLYDDGAAIESVDIKYPWKTDYGKFIETPMIFKNKIEFTISQIDNILGVHLNNKEIIKSLRKMQYDAHIAKNNVIVNIPHYRNDIMHPVDVIEDIVIAYGYDNIEGMEITSACRGKIKEKSIFESQLRRVMIGLGFQEILSPILSSLEVQNKKMCCQMSVVEIENFISDNYSAVRSWMLPNILSCLSKNLHVAYPQKVFEIGHCTLDKNQEVKTLNKISAAIIDNRVGYEDVSSCIENLLLSFGIDYIVRYIEHPSFVQGRSAAVFSKGREIGIFGEISPAVLNNWFLEKPCVAFELDVDMIFKILKKD